MNKALKPLVGAILGAYVLTASVTASAQEVTLRMVSAFAENGYLRAAPAATSGSPRSMPKARAYVQINFIGGPKAIPTFEVGNAVKTGVVDMALSHRRVLHQRDARSRLPQAHADPDRRAAQERRVRRRSTRSGTRRPTCSTSAAWSRTSLSTSTSPRRSTNRTSTGLKIRITPVYRDFFQALGANVVTTPPGRGLHRARTRRGRRLRLADRRHLRPQLAGEDQVPHRPGLLRRRSLAHHEPATSSRSLNATQRAYLNKQVLALEAQNTFWTQYAADEIARQDKAGIQTIKFDAADTKAYRRQGLRRRLGRRRQAEPGVRRAASRPCSPSERGGQRSRSVDAACRRLSEPLAGACASLLLLAMMLIIVRRRARCATSPSPACRAAWPGATRSRS